MIKIICLKFVPGNLIVASVKIQIVTVEYLRPPRQKKKFLRGT